MTKMKWDRANRPLLGSEGLANSELSEEDVASILRAPTKRDLRRKAERAMASVQVTVLPTIRRLHCRVCGHQGTVSHAPGRAPTFRCRKCGARI